MPFPSLVSHFLFVGCDLGTDSASIFSMLANSSTPSPTNKIYTSFLHLTSQQPHLPPKLYSVNQAVFFSFLFIFRLANFFRVFIYPTTRSTSELITYHYLNHTIGGRRVSHQIASPFPAIQHHTPCISSLLLHPKNHLSHVKTTLLSNLHCCQPAIHSIPKSTTVPILQILHN